MTANTNSLWMPWKNRFVTASTFIEQMDSTVPDGGWLNADYLFDGIISKRTVWTGIPSTVFLVFDVVPLTALNCIALLNTTMPGALEGNESIIDIYAHGTNLGSDPAVWSASASFKMEALESDSARRWMPHVLFQFPEEYYRYWAVKILSVGSLGIGEIMIGDLVDLPKVLKAPIIQRQVYSRTDIKTEGANEYSYPLDKRSEFDLEFHNLISESQYYGVQQVLYDQWDGLHPLLLVPDLEKLRCMFGKIDQASKHIWRSGRIWNIGGIKFKELSYGYHT